MKILVRNAVPLFAGAAGAIGFTYLYDAIWAEEQLTIGEFLSAGLLGAGVAFLLERSGQLGSDARSKNGNNQRRH